MLSAFHPQRAALGPAPAELTTKGWLHVEAPTEPELARLYKLGIPAALLAHALDEDEIARVDHAAGVTLVVLRVPRAGDRDDAIPFRTTPLAVLFRDELIVTVCGRPSEVVAGVLLASEPELERPGHLVPRLLLQAAGRFLLHVREIAERVERLEDSLQISQRNQEVVGLLHYQKALVRFTTALASNHIMLDRLHRDPRIGLRDDDRDLMEDATVEFQQAIEMTKIQEEILGQMMDAFASIISNNLNGVMKALTALTIIFTIPMMIASFYGMNVTLPGQHHPAAFYGTLAVSMAAVAAMVLGFWRKRWL